MNVNSNLKDGKKVLILFPPFNDCFFGKKWKRSDSPFVPLGILYLATPLVKAGYNVRIIDFHVDHLDEDQYYNSLKDADFILISCFTFAIYNVQRIIKDIKSTNSEATIICGGPLCNEYQSHIENSDITVFGEADMMIVKILELVSEGKSLSDIPGLSYKQNGNLIRNPGLLKVENLDLVDIPKFDISLNKDYGYIYGIWLAKLFPIITTRGCPFKCTFCTFQNVKYRERSVESVLEEIYLRAKDGAKYIVFCDDNFLIHKKRVNRILDSIIQNNLKIKIIIQGRIDMIDYNLCLKLKQANVIMLIFGIESVNQDVLDFYNKKITVEKIRQVINNLNSVGIITISGLIIGAPIERTEHFENTIQFFKRVPQDFLNVNILRYQYPSPLWIEKNRDGLIKDEDFLVYANESLSNFTFMDLLDIQKNIIRSFYNNPGRILRVAYKVTKHFGMLLIIKMLSIYLRNTIYRPPQEFHR